MRPLLALLAPAVLAAQQPRQVTTDDYARAERFLAPSLAPLVTGNASGYTWLDAGKLAFRVTTASGWDWFVIDPRTRTRTAAVDQARLASALTRSGVSNVNANRLQLTFEGDGNAVRATAGARSWTCAVDTYACTANTPPGAPATGGRAPENSVTSPDGKHAAFVKDFNLWVRELASGRDRQMTTDGVKDFSYATNNAGWVRSDEPVLMWSPDSRRIATFQHDARGTGEMYLVHTQVGHPRLEQWKYPLPGDSLIFRMQRVVIDVAAARVVRLKMDPDMHRSTISDHVANGSTPLDVEWYPDGSHVAFVSSSRDHKVATFRVADATTGDVRTVFEERSPTQFQSGFAALGTQNWRVFPKTNEVLWWSQRDNWGHLYVYDLRTGAQVRQLTRGNWNVAEVIRLDSATRTLYFSGVGREAGRDPYFLHAYRIGMDGQGLTLLTPENANHAVAFSPDGQYFINNYSTVTAPQVRVMRRADGTVVSDIARADISKLTATGWKPPTPFTVKARDGNTDLYGLMFTPTRLDSARKHPIVNYIYPGPWGSSVPPRSFFPGALDFQALAELGFVVVMIDGMGTEWRSKSFHDAYYGNMGDNGLPDQVAGMKELAARYRFIDIDRAGIWGHSGGGFATADAMFRYPDFFKVGVSQSGNHDNRLYEDDWGERFQGLLTRTGATDNYASQANQLIASQLKGKLMLAHGMVDDNVPPYNTLAVVDALIKANKDFDLITFPKQQHGYGEDNDYMTRRRWDYFVRHLLGAEPPKEYPLGR